jgi:thymidylate synthase
MLCKDIFASDMDSLVKQAIRNILIYGEKITALRSGAALQDYSVNYILQNPRRRLHTARVGAVQYFCKELLIYFKGTLNAQNGLAKASKFWSIIADDNGDIASNYGYYVFYEKTEANSNQYKWVIENILASRDTRRAIINVNQNYHKKKDTKDFPCTVMIVFYIRKNKLFCEVFSRSIDVITGLPYDMGFFSFIHELVFRDLSERGVKHLELGDTVIKASFTQIYDKTLSKAFDALNGKSQDDSISMPIISDANELLKDIYNQSCQSKIMQWITKYAQNKDSKSCSNF